MPRRWRGAITIENVQTGDGRVFAPGAIEWADLPLPLNWMSEGGSLHVDLSTTAPQIGIIETIERVGDEIIGEGTIDDATPEGAEIIRRMDEGLAPLGNRFPVSIDPDNWDVEVIMTDAAEADDVIMLMASGRGPLDVSNVRAALVAALRAAAGDPDPGPDGGDGGEVLFQDSVDEILERYLRLRIRGATLCDIAAFDGAFIELVAVGAEDAPAEAPAEPAAAVRAQPVAAALSIPTAPPIDWFRMPEPEPGDDRLVQQVDGSWAVPLTITDDGQVFSHIARRSQGHRGYSTYLPPPTSATAYREFHTGVVVCEDGTEIPTGAMIVGCDHATLELTIGEARDHYAHSGQGWADVRVIDGEYGPWACGALRPTVTENDLRVLRALSLSGDWRPEGGSLEMCSVLSVNVPGYPIAREAMAASALVASGVPEVCRPRARVADGQLVALVSAGMVTRCSECAERARLEQTREEWRDAMTAALDAQTRMLRAIDARTRHLDEAAITAAMGRLQAAGMDRP